MSPTFAELGAPADFADFLATRGILTAFDIQTQALPPALSGRDICGRAPTGSGKTLAFGIPIAQRVHKAKPRKPKALILAPTRELATQISDELKPLLRLRGRTIATFFGGVSFGPQMSALHRGVDVAVACPGRLADLVRRNSISLDDVEIVVVDEADRMADMGFLPEVRKILDMARSDRQTLLFSATLDNAVDVLIRNYQHDPVRCEVAAPTKEEDRNAHHFVEATKGARLQLTVDLIVEHGSTMVFTRTKHGADRLTKQLTAAGISAVAIHGNRSQAQRERALASFSSRRVQALVATDVAARGIHVDDVACVVHFDVPTDAKDYLHRSGRTGRAGATGVVVSLVTEDDGGKVRKLKTALGLPGGSPRHESRESRPQGDKPRTASDRPPRSSRPRGHVQPRHPQPRPKGARATGASSGSARPTGRAKPRRRKP
jgi:superfamily II DNA/RNA helicase